MTNNQWLEELRKEFMKYQHHPDCFYEKTETCDCGMELKWDFVREKVISRTLEEAERRVDEEYREIIATSQPSDYQAGRKVSIAKVEQILEEMKKEI